MAAQRKVFPPKGKVIQCAVGFEIEIRFTPFRNMEHFNEYVKSFIPFRDSKFERFKKNDVLLKGLDFELRVDLSMEDMMPYLEIVTAPFEESAAGLKKMNAAFEVLHMMMRDLTRADGDEASALDFYQIFGNYGEIKGKDRTIRLLGHPPFYEGVFQVTAGIGLERIPIVFRDLAWPDDDEDPDLVRRREMGRRWLIGWKREKADEYDPDLSRARKFQKINEVIRGLRVFSTEGSSRIMSGPVPWSPSLEGLLSMIAQYLLLTHTRLRRYPKSFAVLLSRNDFASLFQLLSAEQKAFFNAGQNWSHFMKILSSRLEVGDAEEPLFSGGVFHGFGGEFKELRHAFAPLSRMDWLVQIPKGKDLLTEKFFPVREHKHFFKSFGEFGGKMDSVDIAGLKMNAPIFEFRMIGFRLHFWQWKNFAQAAHSWISALNSGKDVKFGETEGFMGF
ncbi:MAG: hypothetical protein MI784_16520 [Cytophagales bacterium]|nr:hypothetical protein [Cytophagales bacterium]